MFQINWKVKSLLYKIFSLFKLYKFLFFVQKRITKRTNINFQHHLYYWDYHYKYLKENNSKKIIEIGAGKSLAQNIYLSYKFDRKIEQTLIDVTNMFDLDLFNNANDQISKILKVDRFPSANSINDLKKKYNLNYLAPMNLKNVEESNLQFDACISSSTLEHLPTVELEENFYLLKKIIKKDGIILAAIDYSDHYSHTDKAIENLNFLQFNENEWRKYNSPMLFQNRLRHQDYRKIFKQAGYKVFEIKGNYGNYPKIVSNNFNTNNEETLMLWGYFLLRI